MPCAGAFATADEYAAFWCLDLDSSEEEAIVNMVLEIAASDIHAAMAATGQCDCALASWADVFLRKLNIIDAAIYHKCPCASTKISDAMRQAFLAWITNELTNIRMGKLELCAGETGADFPYTSWAELGTTEFAQVNIIVNDILRNS